MRCVYSTYIQWNAISNYAIECLFGFLRCSLSCWQRNKGIRPISTHPSSQTAIAACMQTKIDVRIIRSTDELIWIFVAQSAPCDSQTTEGIWNYKVARISWVWLVVSATIATELWPFERWKFITNFSCTLFVWHANVTHLLLWLRPCCLP